MTAIPTKAARYTPNSWTAFVARVKELCQGTSDMNKKDYANMMQAYIHGNSAESYLESRS